MSRTFLGTRRYSHLRGEDLYRAMLDHPIQAAAADMVNTVIVQTDRELGLHLWLRWTKHDFASWGFRDRQYLQRAINIAEQEWDADGIKFRVPVTAYTRWYGEEKKPWVSPSF